MEGLYSVCLAFLKPQCTHRACLWLQDRQSGFLPIFLPWMVRRPERERCGASHRVVQQKHGEKQTGSRSATADEKRAGIPVTSLKLGYSLLNQVDRTPLCRFTSIVAKSVTRVSPSRCPSASTRKKQLDVQSARAPKLCPNTSRFSPRPRERAE